MSMPNALVDSRGVSNALRVGNAVIGLVNACVYHAHENKYRAMRSERQYINGGDFDITE